MCGDDYTGMCSVNIMLHIAHDLIDGTLTDHQLRVIVIWVNISNSHCELPFTKKNVSPVIIELVKSNMNLQSNPIWKTL